ncbi:MAG: flagellar M-ring protein FliF [Bacteroidetes bacterium]|nr:flagellar M-ring protein FliF [Bacteroidota bacterium]
MEPIKDFFANLSAMIGRMTASQVMMLFGVVAGTLVGIFLMVGWVNDITYSRLYSDLDESEAGEVVTYLTDNNIPYQLSDGGRVVSVPTDDVYKTRISLAAEGLPRNGTVGYALFDGNNLGMTDFLQNLNFRRALEGELTRTIMQLSEVQAARVHIVMPQDRLFKEDQQQATASVVLKLKGGGLNKNQLNGISHLVASSVEGLKPENISVVDYDGNLLSSGRQSDALAGLTSSQLDVRKQAELYLEDKAQSMLDNVLGPDRSVVRVTADLNFDQLERTSESYDPNSPSVRSEERTKVANSSSDKADETSESQEEGNTETTITNYELNKTVEHIINGIGSIQRLSVAVMVDGVYKEAEPGAEAGETVYQPRSQEELDRLAAIVKNAVGFDPQRSDQIEMVNIAFDRRNLVDDRQALDSMYEREFYLDLAKKIGLGLLAVFGFLYLRKKAGKLFKAMGALAPPPRTRPVARSTSGNPGVDEEEIEEAPKRVVHEARRTRLVDEMQEVAKQQPEEIARAIQTMMIDQ